MSKIFSRSFRTNHEITHEDPEIFIFLSNDQDIDEFNEKLGVSDLTFSEVKKKIFDSHKNKMNQSITQLTKDDYRVTIIKCHNAE